MIKEEATVKVNTKKLVDLKEKLLCLSIYRVRQLELPWLCCKTSSAVSQNPQNPNISAMAMFAFSGIRRNPGRRRGISGSKATGISSPFFPPEELHQRPSLAMPFLFVD
ncbi:hypothetical protein V6N12_054438 [Hibiscus sabdariffa]|uniref:Uncharacterized protein n=1 Tax=Hibiscus sabdariffa TaxID=183260 RepID=A0ABR2D356_9ROSI